MKTTINLSKIAKDPAVAAFLARGERDVGPEPVNITRPPTAPVLRDGAAAKIREVA